MYRFLHGVVELNRTDSAAPAPDAGSRNILWHNISGKLLVFSKGLGVQYGETPVQPES